MKFFLLALLVVSADATNLRTRAPSATTGGLSDATKAAIADQGVNAVTRDSTSESTEADVRGARKSGFSNIENLLNKLRLFVEAERERVDKAHQADVDKAEAQRIRSIQEAVEVRDDKIEKLRLMVEAKTLDRDNKNTIHEGEVGVHGVKVSAHQEAQASLAAALELQTTVVAEARSGHAGGTAACTRGHERATDAAKAQVAKDQAYLNEALAFIGGLRKQLGGFQAGKETALISIRERVRLHQLVATHVSADPKYLNNARIQLRAGQVEAINKAMNLVETRVREEKAAVDERHAANGKAIAKELAACLSIADEARDSALDNMQATLERSTTDEATTKAARTIAKKEMDTAKRILDNANAVLAAALVTQTEETDNANTEFERSKAAAIAEYNEAKASYDQKETDAFTYLDGEMDLISQIATALKAAGAVSTEKLMMLAQMSQRLTTHVKRRLQARYVDSLQGQSGLKDKITAMLNGIDASLKTELEASTEQRTTDTTMAQTFFASTKATAEAVMIKKVNELQASVDAATAAKQFAKGEFDMAKAEEAVALGAMQAAHAVHVAILQQQVDMTIVAKSVLKGEHAEQKETHAQNMGIVDSKQAQGMNYLSQERATVENIRKMLANLGKGYKFMYPKDASSFITITETEGQQAMSMQQKEALATLVSLLGRNGIKYTGAERTFEGTDHTNNQAIIDEVLDQVVAAIAASEAEVDAHHKIDTAQVDSEFDVAWAASENKYSAEIARLQKAVDNAKADLEAKTGVYNGKVAVRKDKEIVYNQKSLELENALNKQQIQGDFARSTYAADSKAAAHYRDNRLEAVEDEFRSDNKYISEEQQAIKDIRAALADINFSMLLESAAKYDAKSKSYMATNSFDMKTKMLTLLAGIENNVNAELARADREFASDTENNKLEKLRADAQAEDYKSSDLAALKKAVEAARAEFQASDAELGTSTQAHALASDKHQEDRDDLATAKKIERTNAPVFEAEYQKSKRNAQEVFAEEMEILDNKKDRGDFYLDTNTRGLSSVNSMLTHLDVTSTDTVDTPNTKTYAKRSAYTTTLADQRFATRTADETARVDTFHEGAVKSFTVDSTNGDKITLAQGPSGEVDRVITEASAQSSGYGFRQEYDARGISVGSLSTANRKCTYQDFTKLMKASSGRKGCDDLEDAVGKSADAYCPCFLQFSMEEAVELGSCTLEGQEHSVAESHQFCTGKWSADKKAEAVDLAAAALTAAKASFLEVAEPGMKVGGFIAALKRAAADEKAKSQGEYDAEVAGVTGTQERLVAKARKERNSLLKKDSDRREASETAFDASLSTLQMALSRKTKATKRHATAAAVLNDALKTNEANTPLVLTEFKNALQFNEASLASATKSVAEKKDEADAYLTDELEMVNKVRQMVEAKLGNSYPQLLEVVSHLVTTRAAKMGQRIYGKSQYDFKVKTSTRMADQQDKSGDDYMENGTVEKNDYGNKVTSIDGMLAQNSGRIANEIHDVAARHTDDMAFLTKERLDALAVARKKRDDTVAALQAIVDAAQTAFDAAFDARTAQQHIRDNARAIYDAKQGRLDAALMLQANNMTAETTIQEDTDDATHAYFDRNMQHYDDEEAQAHGIIKREQGILSEIRRILSEDNLGVAAAKGSSVDKCVAEKKISDAANTASIGSAGECANAKVNAAGKKNFDAQACSRSATDRDVAQAAGAAYAACLSNPASELVAVALIETNKLAAKYIQAGAYTEASAADIAAALAVLDQLDATLLQEDKKVTDSAAQDRVDETNLRDAKLAAALARWTRAKHFHMAAVAFATQVRNETKAEWEKQFEEWRRLLDIQDIKEEELRAAKAKYAYEKAIAEKLKVEEDLTAENRFSREKSRVDDIRRKDTRYLKSEAAAIAELRTLVAELNAKGL